MPTRQMKKSSGQRLVIKTHLQNTMNQPQKQHKTAQNGKGPPPSVETQNSKAQIQTSPSTKNRGRRRGRGGRKSDQGDAFMRPSSRPCTVLHKPANPSCDLLVNAQNGSIGNAGNVCEMQMGLGFPTSSKSSSYAPRPGYGQLGTKCIVKANHFLAELPDKDLNQYDVTITPEVASRTTNRAIIAELVRLHKESELGMRMPAYDGRKSLYTAGELPFAWKEFTIKLLDEDDGTNGPKREKEYNVVIKFVARANLHHWGNF